MRAAKLLVVLSWLAAFSAAPGEAIVRRHDRSDRLYQIESSEAPGFVDVMGRVGGTLIAPEWVLTSAHSVEGVDPFSDWRVSIEGRRYDVTKIILHPMRVSGAVDPDFDLALLKLAAPVAAISPVPLYRWSDEIGLVARIVGRGVHGAGVHDGRRHQRDALLRRAFARVDGVYEHALAFVFDTPPRGENLEGAAAAGDSGGPAYLERDGVLYLAGVDSTNSGDGVEAARYGTLDSFTRVSAHAAWIDATIAADPPSSLTDWPPLMRADTASGFPATPAGALATQFLDAMQSDAGASAFFAAHGAKSAVDAQQQAEHWREHAARVGVQTLWGSTALDANNIAFVTEGAGRVWLGYLFVIDDNDNARIANIFSGSLDGPPSGPSR